MANPAAETPTAATKTTASGMTLADASWWLVVSKISAIALTVFSAVAAYSILYFSSKVDAMKAAELLIFQTESKVAISSAEARAAEANKMAEEASEGTAKALAEAAGANERTKALEVEAGKQRERAAKAEKDLLELQERINPRRITAQQRARLLALLAAASPKGTVGILCVLGDGEGVAFAQQIDEVLKAAGWTTTGVSQGAYSGGNPRGLGVLVRNPANPPVHASTLQRAFTAAGIQLPGAQKPDLAVDAVEIIVGNKP